MARLGHRVTLDTQNLMTRAINTWLPKRNTAKPAWLPVPWLKAVSAFSFSGIDSRDVQGVDQAICAHSLRPGEAERVMFHY
jgi:hypothetical protein